MKNDFVKSRIIRIMWGCIDILALCTCKIVSLFMRERKHWVLVERGYDARDNAYAFYKYLKKNHPEQKVYFIINKKSVDYGKVEEDAVYLGSLKNYWVISTAKKLISTHYGTGIPSFIGSIFKLCGLQKKLYFLQHGIIQANLSSLKYPVASMRLFVCGAKPEYEYVLKNFGHPRGVVRYTGLARFDSLHNVDIKIKQLIVMPTWRYYIRSREQFIDSEYYRHWQDLISDEKLLQWLELNDLKLIFYVHYEFQKYVECFCSKSERVVIAKFSEYDVQMLLKESAVLITDYSSVHFDFAYMRKPTLYYQFDEELYYKNHYHQGYFKHRDMGFGKVCNTCEELISSLMNIVADGSHVDEKYLRRIDDFFPLYDTDNCKRIYDAIMND